MCGTKLPFDWTIRMSACHYPTSRFVEEWLVAPMSNEREKRHIDKVRDSALSMQVGDDNDGSVTGMVNVANSDLYIIKKNAIFRVFLADDIDPERKNINIPNGHQRIASQGSESEIVARSFLTANVLFNSNQFDGAADVKKIMDLSMAVMKDLLAAQSIESEIARERNNALAEFKQPKQRSVALPSVEGLSERFKTFVQRIEHATQAIYRFSQQFYDHTDRMWNGFESEIRKKYGEADEFSQFAGSIRPFMVFVRNLRNSIEHPKASQCVIIKDFAITPDGTLTSPTVQLVHPTSPQPEMNVHEFLPQVNSQVLDVFEALMVHVASKHIKPSGAFEKAVGLLAPDQLRPNSKVRASYFIWINDGWNKLG